MYHQLIPQMCYEKKMAYRNCFDCFVNKFFDQEKERIRTSFDQNVFGRYVWCDGKKMLLF